MARWAEARLLLALIVVCMPQALPGDLTDRPQAASGDVPGGVSHPRAVLLEAADLYTQPSTSDGELVQRLEAGTVLEYIGEVTDTYGRTWNVVRDPGRRERSSDTYLAAFDVRDLARYGHRAALLANRSPLNALAGAAAAAALPGVAAPSVGGAPGATPTAGGLPEGASAEPWWKMVAVAEPTDQVGFDDIVGISAVAVREGELNEAVDLLGGREAIAAWPSDPEPGELFVPAMLPALYEYDGARWELERPVRFLGEGINLLGNGDFAVDPDAPPLAGGPVLHCWELINALDERGAPAGSVSRATAPRPVRRGQPPAVDAGPFDPSAAPPILQQLLPPAPDAARVPPRVDPPAGPSGVVLADNAGRQAVYLQQRLGPALTRRLRGRSVVVDVVARDAPSAGAATFGINVDATFADGRPPQVFAEPYTSRPTPARYDLAFEVPPDAHELLVRLLPLDRTLAVEQQGSVVFERAGLRLASWDPEPRPATIILNRVVVSAFEGATVYTRAPVAPTDRDAQAVERLWPALARSEWTIEDQQHVVAGTVRAGMSREQVAVAWGRPSAENAQADGEGVEWRWDRDDRYVVFTNGTVAVFRPPAEDEVEVQQPMCPGVVAPEATASATAAGGQR